MLAIIALQTRLSQQAYKEPIGFCKIVTKMIWPFNEGSKVFELNMRKLDGLKNAYNFLDEFFLILISIKPFHVG